MNFDDIVSGEDFERFVKNKIQQNRNAIIYDTPTSNDYGADLIMDFQKSRYCIQCKFYTSPIGVRAVQEVYSSLNYYNANFGVVITNSTFTQQAYNLAEKNHIFLMQRCSNESKIFEEIIQFFSSNIPKPMINDEIWTVQDLVVRYGVSNAKIYKDCLGNGLPYTKVGREYRFNPSEVKEWEKCKKYIPIGHNGNKILPAYKELINYIKTEYKTAKKNKDEPSLQKIRNYVEKYHVNYFEYHDLTWYMFAIGLLIVFLPIIIFC